MSKWVFKMDLHKPVDIGNKVSYESVEIIVNLNCSFLDNR